MSTPVHPRYIVKSWPTLVTEGGFCYTLVGNIPWICGGRTNMRSDQIKKGIDRAPHRSLLKAVGLKDEDFDKPFIGICNSFVEIIPGHIHLQEFGRLVKEAVREAGGVPFEFNTIG